MCLKMKWFWIIGILPIILLGIVIGINMFDNDTKKNKYNNFENVADFNENNIVILISIEISNQEERTTPNTLMIYKTYYTKCKYGSYKTVNSNFL